MINIKKISTLIVATAFIDFGRAGLVLAFLLMPGILLGNGRVYDTEQVHPETGKRIYAAAILREKFQPYDAKQEKSNWCWAACVQMVLHYQGIHIKQEELVRRVKGSARNEGGTASDMAQAADGWQVNGKVLKARFINRSGVPGVSKHLIDDLANKYPIIVGLDIPRQRDGHAYVLTAIYYYTDNNDANGPKTPYKVILRDPSPHSRKYFPEEMSWREFYNNVNCVIYVHPVASN